MEIKDLKKDSKDLKVIGKIIFSRPQIEEKIKELGQEITKDYQGKDLLVISILRGGVFFLTDLVRAINLPLSIDFMGISTYGISDTSGGVVRITKDLEEVIENKDVLIAKDIIDTGLTISYLLRNLKARYPKSIEICTLLDRDIRRMTNLNIKYKGFNIGEKYIVGYGLDYKQKYRNLDSIYELKIDAVKRDIESIKQNSK
ncbi:MAG: hypoxanthine phosphoribosyltransferase [Candidatus Humimicrobiaceae bacterium]